MTTRYFHQSSTSGGQIILLVVIIITATFLLASAVSTITILQSRDVGQTTASIVAALSADTGMERMLYYLFIEEAGSDCPKKNRGPSKDCKRNDFANKPECQSGQSGAWFIEDEEVNGCIAAFTTFGISTQFPQILRSYEIHMP